MQLTFACAARTRIISTLVGLHDNRGEGFATGDKYPGSELNRARQLASLALRDPKNCGCGVDAGAPSGEGEQAFIEAAVGSECRRKVFAGFDLPESTILQYETFCIEQIWSSFSELP